MQMIILGNALSKGPNWQVLPPRTVLCIGLAKLLVMPLVGMGVCVGLYHSLGHGGLRLLGLEPPWNEPFYLAALAMACTPTANNMMVMTEMYGGDRTAMSTAIFAQYALAPLLLTLTLTAAVVLVLSLNGGA